MNAFGTNNNERNPGLNFPMELMPYLGKKSDSDEFDGFLFLPSFRESIDNLVVETPKLAEELLWAIVVYGTENKDVAKTPAIKAIMASIRRTIDAGKDKHKRVLKKQST